MHNTERIINGKQIASNIKQKVALEIASLLKDQNGKMKVPCLAVILVGQDPASQIYTNNKKKETENIGAISKSFILSENINQKELLDLIDNLNNDDTVHGILLQLPLPSHIDSFEAISKIAPHKDVDGFNPINVGLLNAGKSQFVPCTPLGCIHLIKSVENKLDGLNALIVGRSNVVGWPVSKLLSNENATVTVAHSKTNNLKELCQKADIIIACVGKIDIIDQTMVSDKSIIIDVGINRYTNDKGEKKIKGDVDFEKVAPKVRAITPVPGGVGPMTIACLMENLLKAFKLQNNV